MRSVGRTERIWQAYAPEQELSVEQESFINLLVYIAEQSVQETPVADIELLRSSLARYAAVTPFVIELYHRNDFSNTKISQVIDDGKLISVASDAATLIYYKKIPSSPFVLSAKLERDKPEPSFVYRTLIVLFYLVLGVVIYVWILPLTRDLKILQEGTKNIGREGAVEDIQLSPGSAVYRLSQAFNAMSSRLRSLLASQREMTHAISHELRTPLARIKFSLAALESRLQEVPSEVADISANVVEMERLIADFLNYASFEARRSSPRFEPGILAPMVQALVARLSLETVVRVHDRLDGLEVRCDWDLLEHCLSNLLRNASRYAHSAIDVELSVEHGDYVVSVSDDGPGIAKQDRERIFNAFYRGERQRDGNSGFGLGLALVQRIMMWQGGAVLLRESSLGGACFELRWRAGAQPTERDRDTKLN